MVGPMTAEESAAALAPIEGERWYVLTCITCGFDQGGGRTIPGWESSLPPGDCVRCGKGRAYVFLDAEGPA